MNKQVSDYLNQVCAPIHSRKTQLLVRAELSGHIANIMEPLMENGMKEEEAARQAMEQMGDPTAIGKEIAELNSPVMNVLMVLAGFVLFITAFAFLGNYLIPLGMIFDFYALIFVLTVTLALVLLGGLTRFTRRSAFERARTSAFYAGAIGAVMGFILMLGRIGDSAALGAAMAFCVTSVLYGIIVSALVNSIAHLTRPLEAEEIQRIIGKGEYGI